MEPQRLLGIEVYTKIVGLNIPTGELPKLCAVTELWLKAIAT